MLASAASDTTAASITDCLAMARGYYQQLYCEVKAKGEGQQLPAFYQFKRNNEQTQWLLLKRPAERAGIALRKPAHKVRQRALAINRPEPLPAGPHPTPAHGSTSTGASNCLLTGEQIRCGDRVYALQRNKHNRNLHPQALSTDNTLELPPFKGAIDNERDVRDYLYRAYALYLDKMRSIGLGGITTSFGNFSYLFYDYHAKGLNFNQRFANLFRYLKKDKATLPISDKAADTRQLTLADCAPLADQYFVCEHQGKNLLFSR